MTTFKVTAELSKLLKQNEMGCGDLFVARDMVLVCVINTVSLMIFSLLCSNHTCTSKTCKVIATKRADYGILSSLY